MASLEHLSDFCTSLKWISLTSLNLAMVEYSFSLVISVLLWMLIIPLEPATSYHDWPVDVSEISKKRICFTLSSRRYLFKRGIIVSHRPRHLFCHSALFSALLFLALWGSAVLREWQHDLSLFTVTPAAALLRLALKGSRLSEVINNTEPQ